MLFFGKISQKYDTNQLSQGYYEASKGSSWYGELEIGDYVYLIGGDKVQYWRAKEWKMVNEKDRLYFEILNPNIGISITKFLSLEFFKISKALAVLTSRSARNKAFFSIELTQDIPLESLAETALYQDPLHFRKISLLKNGAEADPNSIDIQLYLDQDQHLAIFPSPFINSDVLSLFRDNLKFIGKGAKRKDTTLKALKLGLEKAPVDISLEAISLRSLYDVLFCEYKTTSNYYLLGAYWDEADPKDRTEAFIKEGIWYNGFEDTFIKEVKAIAVGSNVAIKSAYVSGGKSAIKIKTLGIVTANAGDGRTLEVEWEENFKPFELKIGGYRKTYHMVTNEEHIDLIWGAPGEDPGPGEPDKPEKNMAEKDPLNQILYGPPGTGKTYNSIDAAVRIATGESADHAANKKIFDQLRREGQIEFVTFHQGYAYEDFMVGIKPNVDAAELTFRPYKGIFYRLVESAKENYLASKEARSTLKSFDEVFAELLAPLEQEQPVPITMASGIKFNITDVQNGTIRFEKQNQTNNHSLSVETLRAIVEGKREFNSGLGVYYQPLVKLLKERQQSTQKKTSLKKYVLIIDEINRANISKVFGELITLLEDDKRIDGDNELAVTLPNGEQNFSIPPNLYIVGTMNTADKSISLIDVALRRRFEFIGCYPNSSLLLENYADRVDLLERLNQAIFERKKTADYLIGHGYFMKPEKTEQIILNKIIPLLMEYFSGRVEEVAGILQAGGKAVHYNTLKFQWEFTTPSPAADEPTAN